MGIINMIRTIKEIHQCDVVFVKIGKFYHTYGKDSYIISYFFGYQLKKVENTNTCAFPHNSLNKVIAKLEENKKVLLEKIISKIKVLDFLLNLCYDKMIINNKKYTKFGEKIDDIIKYTIGWKKSINIGA